MGSSWTQVRSKFKSPWRVVGRCLWLARQRWKRSSARHKAERDAARYEVARLNDELARERERTAALQERLRAAEAENRGLAARPAHVPDDPPLPGHRYGPRTIGLAIELAAAVGLRPSARALEVFWRWQGIERSLPDWTTIRQWLMRTGVAAMEEPVERADDWVWMVDHSNQIGQEKVLVVLGVRAAHLPPPGESLRHEDMRVLALRPGTSWKRDDMAAVYKELADRYGPPRAVLCDGAVELRDGAECLKNEGGNTIVLHDFKHKAATLLRALLECCPRFAAFNAAMGKARAAIQQTEMAHLTPPSQKPKARFMNLGATLEWASAATWLLDQPAAESRHGIAAERLEEKLGWLRGFAVDVQRWRGCQRVIDAGLHFINTQGLSCGAGERLRATLAAAACDATSRQLADRLVDFAAAAEAELRPGERLPMSTEILESSFALYKQLEGQHSKGGFTSLLAAFPALLRPISESTVRRAFATVSTQRVREWTKANLGTTLTSKRQTLYAEFRSATEIITTT